MRHLNREYLDFARRLSYTYGKSDKGCETSVAAGKQEKRHWFEYAVIGMRAVWLIGGLYGLFGHQDSFLAKSPLDLSGAMVWLAAAGYVLTFAVPLAAHYAGERIPAYVPAMIDIAVAGSVYVALSSYPADGFEFYNVPVLTLGYLSRGRHAAWAFAASVLLMPALASACWGFPLRAVDGEMFNLAVLFGIGFCFQRIVVSHEKMGVMYGIIQEQNRTLEVYARQIEQLTLAEERNRLSRDLHDTVGHTFTTTIVGMDAVYYLIDLAKEEAKKSLKELLQVTRAGLDEVRKHIHQIAPEQEERSLAANLAQVADEFSRHTGTEAALETVGDEYPVSEQVRWALIRCLQESLTNAKKHGAAVKVQLELTFDRHAVRLRIADDGRGAETLVHGFGLRGMRERLANLNGTLQVESRPGQGTVVTCAVPVRLDDGAQTDNDSREGA